MSYGLMLLTKMHPAEFLRHYLESSVIYLDFSFFLACAHALLLLPHLPPLFEPPEDEDSFGLAMFKPKLSSLFANKKILKLSLWAGFTLYIHTQVIDRFQILWFYGERINNLAAYNAPMVAVAMLTSTLLVLLAGRFVRISWKFDNALLAGAALLQGVFLLAMEATSSMWAINLLFVLYVASYHVAMVMVMGQLGKKSYKRGCLMFGFCFVGFLGPLCQAVLTDLVDGAMGGRVRGFLVYGAFHLGMSVLVSLVWLLC